MAHLILETVNIEPLMKAHIALQSALKQATSQLERAGAIQYFEFSYELSWKILKKILFALGKRDLNSPKPIFRAAALEGLIDDPELWFSFMEQRNLTVHTYNEEVALQIFAVLPQFEQALATLITKIERLS